MARPMKEILAMHHLVLPLLPFPELHRQTLLSIAFLSMISITNLAPLLWPKNSAIYKLYDECP